MVNVSDGVADIRGLRRLEGLVDGGWFTRPVLEIDSLRGRGRQPADTWPMLGEMPELSCHEAALLELPLEVLTAVCLQLDLLDLVNVAAACKRFRHGDCGLETAELPTKSPVVMALRALAFPHLELAPNTRPIGCSESWVAYLARCVQQRRCREEAHFMAAGLHHSVLLDATGRLLTCGMCPAVGHGDARSIFSHPAPVAAMAGIRVRCVAAVSNSSFALSWDGRGYSWGENGRGQLGLGNDRARHSPTLVEGLEGVRSFHAAYGHSLAVTQSGGVFLWGTGLSLELKSELRPIMVEGFGEVRVRRVCAGNTIAFAVGEAGELFSWGYGGFETLGHGDVQDQLSPKRVEALRSVRVSSVAAGSFHVLALAEDGQVYSWGRNDHRALLGNPHVERKLLPKPIEALRCVRVGSIAAAGLRSYAVADTGELWEWGAHRDNQGPLGQGELIHCCIPKLIESLRGIKVAAVTASDHHTLALAHDGSVYAWGAGLAVSWGALGLGPSVTSMNDAQTCVPTPQRVPALRVACGL
jgi:alpha-tubulin suppressor-like RCC1 family protein